MSRAELIGGFASRAVTDSVTADPDTNHDLMRHRESGELISINQWKASEFIRENPLFYIAGIGLSREATDTPYGKIGAVLE